MDNGGAETQECDAISQAISSKAFKTRYGFSTKQTWQLSVEGWSHRNFRQAGSVRKNWQTIWQECIYLSRQFREWLYATSHCTTLWVPGTIPEGLDDSEKLKNFMNWFDCGKEAYNWSTCEFIDMRVHQRASSSPRRAIIRNLNFWHSDWLLIWYA